MKNFKAYFTAVMVGLIFAAGVTFAAGESRFRDLIVRTAASIGTSSAANSKAVLDLVSTTKGFLPPRMTEVQRDAIATPPQGLIVFNTTTQTLNQYNGTAWEEIGGGGSGVGGINFIENTDFETNITGYNTYADAAAATPVDGTGGSSSLTLSQTTTAGEVQRGAASLKIAKGAVNEQGEGVSYDFTVDGIDNAASKKIIVTFDYETSANYASDEIRLFVYDRDAATLQAVLNSGSGNLKFCTTGCKFVGEFYTTSGSNDYRLIWHVAGTSATAYDVYIDNIRAGPDSPTPTSITQDLGTEAWTVVNATATSSIRIFRTGNRIFVDGTISFTGSASGLIGLTIPTAYRPSNTDYPQLGTVNTMLGWARFLDAGTSQYDGTAQLVTLSNISFYAANVASTYGFSTATSNTIPFTWANTDQITFQGSWIVSGWNTGNSISAQEASVSTVKARYSTNVAQSMSNGSPTRIDFEDREYDTHNAVTTGASWVFTAPKTGYYKVTSMATLATSANWAAGEPLAFSVYKNGSAYALIDYKQSTGGGNFIFAGSGSTTVQLNRGDTVDVRLTQASGGAINLNGISSDNWISIEEDPDFSVFGVYGNFEVRTAVSNTKTPGASANYYSMTGNSIALDPGTWELTGNISFFNGGSTPTYASYLGYWGAANGADSGVAPASITTVSGLTVRNNLLNPLIDGVSSGGNYTLNMPKLIVTTTAASSTIFLVPYATMTTPGNARIITYITAERLQ